MGRAATSSPCRKRSRKVVVRPTAASTPEPLANRYLGIYGHTAWEFPLAGGSVIPLQATDFSVLQRAREVVGKPADVRRRSAPKSARLPRQHARVTLRTANNAVTQAEDLD